MSKLLKKFKLKNLIFTISVLITGIVIGRVVGVTATTNRLEAKYVMYTKDGETMTVQDAIKDLYVLAKNKGGNNQELVLGDVAVSGTQITIPYTGSYPTIRCVYGTIESYGNEGTISGNTCTFSGSSNTKYYYKLIATNNAGIIYENSGNKTTLIGPSLILAGLPTGVNAIVYLDPTDLTRDCNASNSISTTGTKSGCMKWYAFSEDNTSYTMILDHNTTAKVTWNSEYTNASKKEIQTELNNLKNVTGWKVTPRLIHAQEIADITGNTSWTSGGSNFVLNGKGSGQATGSNIYYWLFDYTTGCTKYGCKVADSSTKGYWTDTAYTGDSTHVWSVYRSGNLGYYSANRTDVGVRPVITVQKSNF